MKKGFTLVELLAVIIILGLVGLIVIPSITKLIKDSRQDLYKNQVRTIEESARKWGVKHIDSLVPNTTIYVSLTDLINSGYIEQDKIKDPRTNTDMNGCVAISHNSISDKYKYTYDERECAEMDDSKNMTSTDSQYVCYDFDANTGTIVKYDVDNTNCLSDVVIPYKIDNVVVKHIGNAAFINETGQSCYANSYGEGDEFSVSHNYVRQEGDIYYGCWFDLTERNINITSVIFPRYLETIGTSSFAYHSISSLDFSNSPSLTKINDDAFYDNPIESINFTNASKLESIGTYTFSETSLMSVDLRPLTNLTTIEYNAFSGSNITTLNFQGLTNLTRIEYEAFEDNIITSVTIPASVEVIRHNAFAWNPLVRVTIEGDNKFRFNDIWAAIGFPSSLKPSVEITEVSKALTISSSNDFSFENAYYKVTAPTTGNYRFEVWGAQGGNSLDDGYERIVQGGKGAYSSGNYYLTAGQIIYVYVGSVGESSGEYGAGGGGASEIRTSKALTTPLTASERLIVAGGGGGGGYYGGGGGGGYCGGGGGGSSYTGGVTSGQTIAGNASMPNPSGGNMIGRLGNGFARITYLGT